MEKNIKCLIQACKNADFEYQFIDKEHNFIRINILDNWEYFQLSTTPFNTAVMQGICKDKMHTYEVLNKGVKMPKTVSFLDINIAEEYSIYLVQHSIDLVVSKIENTFDYPVVIKSNKGDSGVNVYLCPDQKSTINSFQKIFNQNSKDYDYIALAQQFIATAEEYRLVCFNGQPLLAYKRGNAHSFNAKYWENNEVAKLIKEPLLIKELYQFIKPVFQQLAIGFVGFDIIRGQDQQLYLIELNASPKFNHLIDGNGEDCVINMYQQILSLLTEKTK